MYMHRFRDYFTINNMSQIKGKESENSYQELKRSPKDRHTQTHGNCIEILTSDNFPPAIPLATPWWYIS